MFMFVMLSAKLNEKNRTVLPNRQVLGMRWRQRIKWDFREAWYFSAVYSTQKHCWGWIGFGCFPDFYKETFFKNHIISCTKIKYQQTRYLDFVFLFQWSIISMSYIVCTWYHGPVHTDHVDCWMINYIFYNNHCIVMSDLIDKSYSLRSFVQSRI